MRQSRSVTRELRRRKSRQRPRNRFAPLKTTPLYATIMRDRSLKRSTKANRSPPARWFRKRSMSVRKVAASVSSGRATMHDGRAAAHHPTGARACLGGRGAPARQNPEKMRVRRETVEHPFRTIKARMGAIHYSNTGVFDDGGIAEGDLRRASSLHSAHGGPHAAVASSLGHESHEAAEPALAPDGSPPITRTTLRRAMPTTPADRAGAHVDCFPAHAAFPKWPERRHRTGTLQQRRKRQPNGAEGRD